MLLEKTRQECFILIALDKYLGKLKLGNMKNLRVCWCPIPWLLGLVFYVKLDSLCCANCSLFGMITIPLTETPHFSILCLCWDNF